MSKTWQNRPAAHSDAAILTCDAGHLPYAYVAASHIAATEPDRRFDVVVASPDIDRLPPACHAGPVRLVGLDVTRAPDMAHPVARITMGTYYRHLLPAALKGQYRALFYLDADTWLRRAGIQGLLDRMPRDLALAAVPDFEYRLDLEERAEVGDAEARARYAALAQGRDYWQSGVLLMGVERYLARGIDARVLDWAKSHEETLRTHRIGEQGALNAACGDEVSRLDPRWNWQKKRFLRADMVARFDPFVLHFAGREKPWLIQDDPFVATFNDAWWAGLAALDPDFRPETQPRSLARYRQQPRYRFPPLDAVHRWRKDRRNARVIARAAPTEGAVAAMEALIASSEVA